MMGDPAFAGVLESLKAVLSGLTTMMGSVSPSTPPNGGPPAGQMPVNKFDPVQQTPVEQFLPGQFVQQGGHEHHRFTHGQGIDESGRTSGRSV